jgi:hypothetical protein
MSDKAIGFRPNPFVLREMPKDPELRRRTEALFRNLGGLEDKGFGTVQSADPPRRVDPQSSSSATDRITELDKEAEIALLRRLLGVNAPPAPGGQFEIINQQKPLPPNIGVPTIMKLEPNGQFMPFGTDQTLAEAKSPEQQPTIPQADHPRPLIDVEQRKAEVRKELGLKEDYRRNDEINLSQAVILLKNFRLVACEMAPLSHFLPITLTQNTKGCVQQSSTMLSAPELKAKIANTKTAVHCSKHSVLVCFRD